MALPLRNPAWRHAAWLPLAALLLIGSALAQAAEPDSAATLREHHAQLAPQLERSCKAALTPWWRSPSSWHASTCNSPLRGVKS